MTLLERMESTRASLDGQDSRGFWFPGLDPSREQLISNLSQEAILELQRLGSTA